MRAAVRPLLGSAWRRGLDLLFPPRCAGCGSFGALLCEACLAHMTPARPPRCRICWQPCPGSSCGRCREQPPAYTAARSAFVYAGPAREAVHALKYHGVSALAEPMAQAMATVMGEFAPPADALVPVPLTGRRRRARGFNQSEALARELSALTGVPVERRFLERRGSSPTQARAVDEAARRANVADVFSARRRDGHTGGLLLVDDVMTSGVTLDACARALRSAGHGPVCALVFARED